MKYGEFKKCKGCPALKHYLKVLKANQEYGREYRKRNHEREIARGREYRKRKKDEGSQMPSGVEGITNG